MTFKKVILFIHRWLGFISGLVVFIVSITGCIFCFQDEIQDALFDYRTVTIQSKPYVAPSILKETALKLHPKATASYIYYYGKDRPAAVLVSTKKDDYEYVYLNPYKGNITHVEAIGSNFFTIVETIHLYLLLPPKIGQYIVGISVIIFLVLMVTGIILWWPKRKSDRKRSFGIKWNGRWRRVNYDLHNVLGFYATAIAIILAITGLSIAFDWIDTGIYKAANLGKAYPSEKIKTKSDSLRKTTLANQPIIDKAFFTAQAQLPQAEMFLIYDDAANAGTINITAYKKSLHYGNSDYFFFDKYTGKLLKYLPNSAKSLGLKINDLNYDIHVGQALGLTGKIIAFLASLICASLPVTGFVIWWGKRNKTGKRVSPAKAAVQRRNYKQAQKT